MDGNAQRDQALVPLGYVSGVHGVQGWVKIHSWTDPLEAILEYRPWRVGENQEPVEVIEGRRQGKTLVARLPGVTDRDQAQAWVGREIAVLRQQLPEPAGEHWYWADLVGLEVINTDGDRLGRIERMMETGANDVMVVSGETEILVPFVPGVYVVSVDIEAGTVVVDWQRDYLA
ncbi:MAG: ribosome maturation factor RimM [Xanthomonadales bacterium]|nr:ribosome maturation factor RimM [Xanthomonadales bacterium]